MNSVQKIIKIFNNGGVVVYPTDTAYGIGCRIDKAASVNKVFKIKKRSYDNALLVLVDSIEMAEKYVIIPTEVKDKLINKYWPGGLTIFFKVISGKVPGAVRANTDILAVRLPNNQTIREIIRKVQVPIIATSANISGEKTPYELNQVNKEILNKVDGIMEGECTYKRESTIIDTTVVPWRTIRQGVVDIEL